MDKVKVLLAGAGQLATSVHYPSLAEMEDVEMVAICDRVKEKVNQAGDRFKIEKRYTDFQKMLDKEDAHAAYIIMPPHLLFDLVISTLRSRRHVFIEKPPSVTSFQVQSFIREADKNDVLGMVGFNRRYMPVLNHAKQIVEEQGEITQVVATFYKKRSAVYYNGVIDVLGCDAVHAVDALRYMIGTEKTVESVHSISGRYGDVVDNAWNAVMRFSNGATGVLLVNWNVGGRIHKLEMHGPGISAFVDPTGNSEVLCDEGTRQLDSHQIAGGDQESKTQGFFVEDRHFIDSIMTGTLPSSSFQDALKTMQLVDRIRNAD